MQSEGQTALTVALTRLGVGVVHSVSIQLEELHRFRFLLSVAAHGEGVLTHLLTGTQGHVTSATVAFGPVIGPHLSRGRTAGDFAIFTQGLAPINLDVIVRFAQISR